MDSRFYNGEGIDVERLGRDLSNAFRMQGYQVQQFGTPAQTVVQLKKGGDFQAILGMQTALTVTLQKAGSGVLATLGQQKWADKAAVGAIGMFVLWPLAITSGVGAVQQANLGNHVLSVLDQVVLQQHANVQIGPPPPHLMAQVQQQWTPPPPDIQAQHMPPAPPM